MDTALQQRGKGLAGTGPCAYPDSHRRDKYLHPWPETTGLLKISQLKGGPGAEGTSQLVTALEILSRTPGSEPCWVQNAQEVTEFISGAVAVALTSSQHSHQKSQLPESRVRYPQARGNSPRQEM